MIGEFSTPGTNDQIIARLYDVNEPGGGTQQLIGRAIYRPINPGGGFTKQVFQLHPQAWAVAAGHVVKLELLVQDSTYARNSSSPQSIQVKNLELRLPTIEAPGSDGGLIQTPLPKYLPPGYVLARDVPSTVPGVPQISSGSNPNANGVFTLAWEPSQAAAGLTYTLAHKNASGGWSTVASGLTSPEYTFSPGGAEQEGTWTYRVLAANEGPESEYSGASAEVKVDKTPPNAPSVTASRPPDYSGRGGWYKDSVEVSFASNGDPPLSDGSPGSGVDLASIPSPQTFNTSGSHTACGTATDNVGNVSAPACLTVQVDATPPSLEITCPATARVGSPASATFAASDEFSGLASEPSGTVAIDTSTAGAKTVSTTAVSNVGLETTKSCTTQVEGSTEVLTGTIKGKLVVKAGHSVELTSTAKVSGTVAVKPGGALDVEGATISGPLNASGAALLRICGAMVAGSVKAVNGSGSVVIGEATEACPASAFHGTVTLKANTGGVLVDENLFYGSLKVTGNGGGVTVTRNTVEGSLTVTGNTGTVVDAPNEVEGVSKLQ